MVRYTILGTLVAAFGSGVNPAVGAVLAAPWWIGVWAVTARRLHDLNLSAWLQFVPALLTGGALAAAYWLGHKDLLSSDATFFASAFGWGITAVWLAYYGYLGFTPGTDGPNAYAEETE